MASHNTFILCKHLGDSVIQVMEVSHIQSVIAMVLHRLDKHGPEEQYYFLVERLELDVVCLGGGDENFS